MVLSRRAGDHDALRLTKREEHDVIYIHSYKIAAAVLSVEQETRVFFA